MPLEPIDVFRITGKFTFNSSKAKLAPSEWFILTVLGVLKPSLLKTIWFNHLSLHMSWHFVEFITVYPSYSNNFVITYHDLAPVFIEEPKPLTIINVSFESISNGGS